MSFGGLYLTIKGQALQAKSQTGVQLNFTRIAVGDGDLGALSISDLNNLIHQIKTLTITKLSTMTAGKAVVGTMLTNQDTPSFYWKELGVFAQDPQEGEILYCYGNAGNLAEYIPTSGGATIIEKMINIPMIIGNATNVTATIDSSLVYATVDYVDTSISSIPKITTDSLEPSSKKANDYWLKIL